MDICAPKNILITGVLFPIMGLKWESIIREVRGIVQNEANCLENMALILP
jgi:hypothetical protein